MFCFCLFVDHKNARFHLGPSLTAAAPLAFLQVYCLILDTPAHPSLFLSASRLQQECEVLVAIQSQERTFKKIESQC